MPEADNSVSVGGLPAPSCADQLRDGDDEAFVAVVSQHQARLLRLAGRFVPTREDAEDVVQETLVAAYQQRRRFRAEASVETWLSRIALYKALRWRRRCRRVPPGGVAGEEKRAAPADPVHIQVRDTVARLPEKLRVPVILRFYEGLSGQEIAGLLGCKQSTVWTRLYRGLRKLKEELERGELR